MNTRTIAIVALVIAIIRTRQTPEVDQYSDLKE